MKAPTTPLLLGDTIAMDQVEEVVRDTLRTTTHHKNDVNRVTNGDQLESRLQSIKDDARERVPGRRPLLGIVRIRAYYAERLFTMTASYPHNAPAAIVAHLKSKGIKRP